jgi:hypothetical protein
MSGDPTATAETTTVQLVHALFNGVDVFVVSIWGVEIDFIYFVFILCRRYKLYYSEELGNGTESVLPSLATVALPLNAALASSR